MITVSGSPAPSISTGLARIAAAMRGAMAGSRAYARASAADRRGVDHDAAAVGGEGHVVDGAAGGVGGGRERGALGGVLGGPVGGRVPIVQPAAGQKAGVVARAVVAGAQLAVVALQVGFGQAQVGEHGAHEPACSSEPTCEAHMMATSRSPQP